MNGTGRDDQSYHPAPPKPESGPRLLLADQRPKFPQHRIGVDAGAMPVAEAEADRIVADRLDLLDHDFRPRLRRHQRQRLPQLDRRMRLRPPRLLPAGGAGTLRAQEDSRQFRTGLVRPVDEDGAVGDDFDADGDGGRGGHDELVDQVRCARISSAASGSRVNVSISA